MKNTEEYSEISKERLATLRKEEKQRVWEEERETNKPEWLKDKEKAEGIGRIVMFLFSKEFLISYALITIFINLFIF